MLLSCKTLTAYPLPECSDPSMPQLGSDPQRPLSTHLSHSSDQIPWPPTPGHPCPGHWPQTRSQWKKLTFLVSCPWVWFLLICLSVLSPNLTILLLQLPQNQLVSIFHYWAPGIPRQREAIIVVKAQTTLKQRTLEKSYWRKETWV